MRDAEFDFNKPAIFNRPDLGWIKYAETRHVPGKELSGNVSSSPRVLNEHKFTSLKPTNISYEDWVAREAQAATDRVNAIKSTYGFDRLAHPFAVHGTSTIDLDKDIDLVDYYSPPSERAQVDATILSKEGSASMIAPADCIIATVAFPEQKAVGQIHIGFQGAVKNIVDSALKSFENKGLDTTQALVYMSPHVQSGFPLTDGQDKILYQLADEVNPEQRSLVLNNVANKNGILVMNLTGLALSEFQRAGIDTGRIEVSPIDTFSSDEVFSEYKGREDQSKDGRFAVIVGIKK